MAKLVVQYAATMFKEGNFDRAARAYWKTLFILGESARPSDQDRLIKFLMKCQEQTSILLEEQPEEGSAAEEVNMQMVASISSLTTDQLLSYHRFLHVLRNATAKVFHTPTYGEAEPRRFVTFLNEGHFIKHKLPRFFSWIVPAYLAGISIPRNKQDIRALEALGVRLVVTTVAESPLPPAFFEGTQVRNVFYPVGNLHPPTVEEVDAFFKEVADVTLQSEASERPGAIAVHCGGGVGRAGTFLACYLTRHGSTVARPFCEACRETASRLNRAVRSADCQGDCANSEPPRMSAMEAINLLRVGRPGSLETAWQEEFVKKYNGILWNRYSCPGVDEDGSLRNGEAADALPLSMAGKPVANPSFVVLVGLPGSGKSWFADKLVSSAEGKWVRISQDVIGSRNDCVKAVSTYTKHLGKGNAAAVILDRCNPSAAERKEWLQLAFQPRDSVAVYFSADKDTCKERIRSRFGHETIRAGGGQHALEDMSKRMEPPTLGEGFSAIYCVHSFENAKSLVDKWTGRGKDTAAKDAKDGKDVKENVSFDPGKVSVEESQSIIKFPRTPHLFDTGGSGVSSDDVVADARAFFNLFNTSRTVHVEEKVDGANLGFSLGPDGRIKVQNRSHYISFKEQKQYEFLPEWIGSRNQRLMHLLDHTPGRRIVYGEWLLAKHAIQYSQLPDYFLAFDIFDVQQKSFYSRERFNAAVDEANALDVGESIIHKVPSVDGVEWSLTRSKEGWMNRLMETKSRYWNGPVEGLYIRVDEGDWLLERMKLVRPDFVAGCENWSRNKITKNMLRQ